MADVEAPPMAGVVVLCSVLATIGVPMPSRGRLEAPGPESSRGQPEGIANEATATECKEQCCRAEVEAAPGKARRGAPDQQMLVTKVVVEADADDPLSLAVKVANVARPPRLGIVRPPLRAAVKKDK